MFTAIRRSAPIHLPLKAALAIIFVVLMLAIARTPSSLAAPAACVAGPGQTCFDIPAPSLLALMAFQDQTGLTLDLPEDKVDQLLNRVHLNPIVGRAPPRQALDRLLDHSGLAVLCEDAGRIVVDEQQFFPSPPVECRKIVDVMRAERGCRGDCATLVLDESPALRAQSTRTPPPPPAPPRPPVESCSAPSGETCLAFNARGDQWIQAFEQVTGLSVEIDPRLTPSPSGVAIQLTTTVLNPMDLLDDIIGASALGVVCYDGKRVVIDERAHFYLQTPLHQCDGLEARLSASRTKCDVDRLAAACNFGLSQTGVMMGYESSVFEACRATPSDPGCLDLGSYGDAAGRVYQPNEAASNLNWFARQTGLTLDFDPANLWRVRLNTVRGRIDPRQALVLALQDTGLAILSDNGGHIHIGPSPPKIFAAPPGEACRPPDGFVGVVECLVN